MSPSLTPNEIGMKLSVSLIAKADSLYASIEHQFRIANPKLVVAHPLTLKNIQAALSLLPYIKADILVIGAAQSGAGFRTLDEVLNEASQKRFVAQSFKLAAGESRTKLAFLCFSSGTTGKPKVRDLLVSIRVVALDIQLHETSRRSLCHITISLYLLCSSQQHKVSTIIDSIVTRRVFA